MVFKLLIDILFEEIFRCAISCSNCFAKIAIPNSSSCCLSEKKVVLSMFHDVVLSEHENLIYLMITFVYLN